jgi:hypothetical protein
MVVGAEIAQNVSKATLDQAREYFCRDVKELRQYFNIRTFTHHGGNIYNLKVKPPDELDVIGVDRTESPALWKPIRSMFSDGGFVSRPSTFRRKVEDLTPGLHFFRNHPFKYGNYTAPVDVPPRFAKDFPRAGLPQDNIIHEWREHELNKEMKWIRQRQASRSSVRLSYLRLEKPISGRFKPFFQVEARVIALRQRRRSTFLRLYPWVEGDPRVFWWRMLDAWTPTSGMLLNVGALPPDQKDEHTAFLSAGVLVKDVDIDPARLPDYVFDISDAPDSLNNSFSGIMLFGLPYFASPSKAVAACARLTAPGGTGLFGFVADTHPARGSLWHPGKRHLWRRGKEPLKKIGLKENLWSFDETGLPDLFLSWSQIHFEFMGHYWFVVAKK